MIRKRRDKEYVSIRVKKESKRLFEFMKVCFSRKMEEKNYRFTNDDFIRFLFEIHEDELRKEAERMGIKFPREIRLSEL